MVFASGSPDTSTCSGTWREHGAGSNLILDMSPDMTSVRESCVTSLRNRDTAWYCARMRTPALHLSQGLTANKPQLPSVHPTSRTPVLRFEKRLLTKKRFRRIAGAVAGIATASTFLHPRRGVSCTFSLRLSNVYTPVESLVASARFQTAPHRRTQSLHCVSPYGIDRVCAARIVTYRQ